MAETQTISASEFKAKCLNILDQLSSNQIDQVTITKRGRTVGVLRPAHDAKVPVDLYGSMRGSVIIQDGFDLTEPVLDEPLDADEGILHR